MYIKYLLCISFIGFCGCVKKNDTVVVIPITPTELSGKTISATQINLTWTDKSTNEKGFKIQRKTGSGSFSDIASLGSDITTYSDNSVIRNTTYTYRVYAFNDAGNSLSYTNEVTLSTWGDAQLTTTNISEITYSTAKSGGNITSDGGNSVTARGVVWSTSPNPTVSLTTKTSNGTGVGAYSSNLVGLTSNTTYYVRAYAINSEGTYYGNEVTFKSLNLLGCNLNDFNSSINYGTMTDQEGNEYKTVTIGTQVWMAENLRTSKYRNGVPIPLLTSNTRWDGLTTGVYCWFNNDSLLNNCRFGRLYNWYAVTDSRNLCPAGWHVPTDMEWTVLTDFLGGSKVAGGKMKTSDGWLNNGNGSNSSGFTGRPGGGLSNIGSFHFLGEQGMWWSSTETGNGFVWLRNTRYQVEEIYRSTSKPDVGFSVRCIKD